MIMRKKSLLVFFITAVLFYTLPAQQSDYVKPSLSDTDSWSLVLLPDPQTYMKFDYNQPIFDLMLA